MNMSRRRKKLLANKQHVIDESRKTDRKVIDCIMISTNNATSMAGGCQSQSPKCEKERNTRAHKQMQAMKQT
jgi:hypothetical protein